MKYHFDGTAAEFVEAQSLTEDASIGLQQAIDGLERIYGYNKESASELYQELIKGGPLDRYNACELQTFFTKLEIAYSVAVASTLVRRDTGIGRRTSDVAKMSCQGSFSHFP